MIDKTASEMKTDEQLQMTLWKWQSRFLFRRQAPQEILKAVDEDDFGEQDDQEMAEAPILTQKVASPGVQ